MPAFAELDTSSNVELSAAGAVVTSLASNAGGNCFDYAQVLRVEHSGGIIPGKAFISVRNLAAPDENGHVTLQTAGPLAANSLKFWSRIKITSNGATIFVGALMKRRDSIGGNSVLLEYWDDRWLLSKIPVRGCLVYDNYTQSVKFLPRYICRTNPGGYKNCTRAGSGGNSDFYVFCEIPERAKQTLCNDQNVGEDDSAAAGEAIYWTPERFLKYLQAIATYAPPSCYSGSWAALDTSKLNWTAAACQFQDGTIRRMMPDITFQGQRVLGAISRTLDVTGEYQIGMDYSNGSPSNLGFYVRDKAVASGNLVSPNSGSARRIINLQRAGAASDVKTIYDGVAETDASELCTGVLVEGAAPKIESEFIFSAGRYSDALSQPWSAQEQAGFLKIISTGKDLNGNDLPGGTNGSLKNTKQALQAARACFPKVFRALQIQGTGLATILNGVGGKYTNYPALLDFKVPLSEQLQPYFESTGVQRGRLRIPIRIQVSDINTTDQTSTPVYHDVTFNSGLRITDDGLLWFDGLSDDLAGIDNIYSGNLALYDGTNLPVLRYIKINCAVPHDTRTSASLDIFRDGADPDAIRDQIDESLNGVYGPSLQHYVLSHDSFQEEHQVNSSPALSGSFQTSDGNQPPKLTTLTTPVNAIIYTDASQLRAHAQRQQKDVARFKRTSSWKLPGIRIDYAIGDFIDRIVFQGVVGEYKIDAALEHIVLDFEKQETVLRPE
jgi:hypothetical protein